MRVPAVPLSDYPSFRLGLPSGRVRDALIKHRAEVVHLASPVVLGALAVREWLTADDAQDDAREREVVLLPENSST